MTLNQSALLELTEVLRTADGGDVMRMMLSAMLQALVDAEASQRIGALPYERSDACTTQRNGTRDKTVAATSGDLTVSGVPVGLQRVDGDDHPAGVSEGLRVAGSFCRTRWIPAESSRTNGSGNRDVVGFRRLPTEAAQ